jgi:hypothetical protein
MDHHFFILQHLFGHYNAGNRFDINLNGSSELSFTHQKCSALHSLFGGEISDIPYIVIHAKDADLGAGTVAPMGSLDI